jgi:hypothetical protein
MSFTETVWERRIDSIEEASSGTPFVPSLDSEWLSGEELHSSVDRHDIQDSVIRSPSPPIRSSSPFINSPVPSETSSSRSLADGNAVPTYVGDQESPSTMAPEGATSSSEGDDNQQPTPTTIDQESSLRSKYWDDDLPDKRRRKPNPKYVQHSNTKVIRDLIHAFLRGWGTNKLQTVPTYYSKMMAAFQLATDPFTVEIDGDLHPCLLASKASQADNPTFEEAMNGPH